MPVIFLWAIPAVIVSHDAEDARLLGDRIVELEAGRIVRTSASDREDAVIDMDEKRAASALRISPHYYNTPGEIDRAIGALAEVLEEMRSTPRA